MTRVADRYRDAIAPVVVDAHEVREHVAGRIRRYRLSHKLHLFSSYDVDRFFEQRAATFRPRKIRRPRKDAPMTAA
jgi:hypothetical protein